jgi:hypothetical protein
MEDDTVEVERLNGAARDVMNSYEELGHLQRRPTRLPRFFDQIPHSTLAAPRLRYACFHLDEDVRLHIVHDRVHPIDHRLLQPDLCVRRLIGVALDDHLVVAGYDRYGPGTLVPTLPYEGCYFSKYANRRGAKSAKSPVDTLLALLALPLTFGTASK